MTVADYRQIATSNLKATYVRLALASPNTQKWCEGPVEGCLGDFEHPICNFGLTTRVPLDVVSRLRETASSRRSFHVYVLPGPESDVAEETLRRGGFQELYTLVELVGPDPSNAKKAVPDFLGGGRQLSPLLATTRETRLRVGRFMADQFFPRQTDAFKLAITEATALASDLELYAVHPFNDEKLPEIAAVMLSRNTEPADSPSLGIYNLCVEPMSQSTGFGSSLVLWALREARRDNCITTLQCDPRLASWYEAMGFWQTGLVRAFGLHRLSTNAK